MTKPDYILKWEKCLEIIKDNLPVEQYDAWFAPISVLEYNNDELNLAVPSQFFVERLEQTYINLLKKTLQRVYGENVKLFYSTNIVKNDDSTAIRTQSNSKTSVAPAKPKTISNPFDNEPINEIDSQLNAKYSFENYCNGESNKLAVSIGQTIASNPNCKTFNPMFLFGPTGVGKTHLIQAIGSKIKENNPKARVLYVSARVFEQQYTSAVYRTNSVNDFINFYQSLDVLIIDDVQEFAGKTSTQNTFFHIFDHLHRNQKQIILSCDRRPADLDGMIDRLISRFKWGISVELFKPDFDLRLDVLKKKAEEDGLTIEKNILEFIANSVTESVRELEGVVVSLLAHATMLNQDITIDLARMVISNSVKIAKRQITFEQIAETVCAHYSIDIDLLFGKSRKREISDTRQLVMYLAKKYTSLSSINIGSRLSRNHATVLHSCKAIEQRLEFEKDFRQELNAIEERLRTA